MDRLAIAGAYSLRMPWEERRASRFRTTGDGNGHLTEVVPIAFVSSRWPVPYYFANQQVNEVSLLTDELTGDEVMIVEQSRVVRKIA